MGVGAIFALVGGAFLVFGTFDTIQANMTKDWPTTEGQVVVSRVVSRIGNISDDGDSTAYSPVIIYQYEIDGTKYIGDQVSTYQLANQTAKTINQKFPIGPVVVSYNPDKPEEAVLLTGLGTANFVFIGLGGTCCLVGLVIFVSAFIKRRRNVTSEPDPAQPSR